LPKVHALRESIAGSFTVSDPPSLLILRRKLERWFASKLLNVCYYFRYHSSFRGCRVGESCPFLHPAKEEIQLLSSQTPTGAGVKILDKYSIAKTAEQQGIAAIIRENFKA